MQRLRSPAAEQHDDDGTFLLFCRPKDLLKLGTANRFFKLEDLVG
jgi:hypothetical protein